MTGRRAGAVWTSGRGSMEGREKMTGSTNIKHTYQLQKTRSIVLVHTNLPHVIGNPHQIAEIAASNVHLVGGRSNAHGITAAGIAAVVARPTALSPRLLHSRVRRLVVGHRGWVNEDKICHSGRDATISRTDCWKLSCRWPLRILRRSPSPRERPIARPRLLAPLSQ